MLLAYDAQHVRDALGEVSEAIVKRHAPALCINLVYAIGFLDPCKEVFNYFLIELMENIRSDGEEDVCK